MKPELKLTLFTDYICPFCFIGDRRLNRLREDYDVKVNFRFIEIHPDTPIDGASVDTLHYSPETWTEMMDGLAEMAREENITFAANRRLANSHRALLLAEAAKRMGAEQFYSLHESLYDSYFVQGRSIGDETVLRELAAASGMDDAFVDAAWRSDECEQTLQKNMRMAVQAGVSGTPTFFIGQRRLIGAVPLADLQSAAMEALER
jgi:predicted DsbA family dithiol-disulfide isomerase